MRVSVVICTYSPEMFDHFVEAVESVLDQTHEDVEAVLVVDGDPDLYDRVVDEYGAQDDVVVLQTEENVGLSASRNLALEHASGEVVAFMDDDAVADQRWVDELVAAYEDHDALAVGGRMTPLWVAGRPPYLPEEFYWLVGVTHRGFPERGWVRNTFGSNISFERDVLLALGGFSTDLGRRGTAHLQGEETEIGAKVEERYGERVWYNPDATVAHKVFEYRTRPTWLLRRAFWQGYSKRWMEVLTPDSGGEESDFLRYLLAKSVPGRLGGIVRQPSPSKLAELGMLVLLVASMGTGYCYGLLKFLASPGVRKDRTDGGSDHRTDTPNTLRVLWIAPDKPDNISVGRRRIADKLEERGIQVTLKPATPGRLIDVFGRGGRYDVVVGTTHAGAIGGCLLGRLRRLPVVVDHIDPIAQLYPTHDRWLCRVVEVMENLSFRFADRVLFVYDEEAERVRSRARTASQTSLGVDFDRFANPDESVVDDAERALSRYDLEENVAIYVGGLEPIYNIGPCIDAFQYLDDWSILVLGTGSLESEVADLATERENVVYLGTVPHEHVPGYLHRADVGLSMVDDPHTLKVLEYLATGLGVVQLEGSAEARFRGVVEYSSTDPRDIAESIRRANRVSRSRNAREISRAFDWGVVSKDYARAIYDAVE